MKQGSGDHESPRGKNMAGTFFGVGVVCRGTTKPANQKHSKIQ